MVKLPFQMKPCDNECGSECGKNLTKCPTYARLSPVLQQVCPDSLNLLNYLHCLPINDVGVPSYHEKINRGMKDIKSPNLIYPVGDSTYIHILSNPEDIRDYYIPIEPCFGEEMDLLIEEIEERLADFVEELDGITDDVERLDTILGIVDNLVQISDRRGTSDSRGTESYKGDEYSGIFSFLKPSPIKNISDNGDDANGGGGNSTLTVLRAGLIKGISSLNSNGKGRMRGLRLLKNSLNKNKAKKIRMTVNQYNSVRYLMQRSLVGLGLIEPMIKDTNIEDISCSGLGHVFVEHKVFSGLKSTIGYNTHEDLDKYVLQMAERIKHPVTFRDPCVDATLPDGSRINIVYGTDVSKRGTNFTIRKFQDVPLSIIDLINFGALNFEMAAYFSLVLQEEMSIFVSGETASGKTTLLNALTTFIKPNAKIVSIEDTPEVQIPHPNWIRGVTRGNAKRGSEMSEVSMFDLLKAALRQRPNMIIVGEIRGVEGSVAFQAMQTGHACMSTFHASSVPKLIQRLTGDPINVPKSYIDSLNLVVIQQAVRLPNGSNGRRITSINEIVKYDSVTDSFAFVEVFSWNPVTDVHEFKGFNNSMLLEEKIAPKRGIPPEKRRQIYSLLKQRAEVLSRLKERNVTEFWEVYNVLSKAYREGLFK